MTTEQTTTERLAEACKLASVYIGHGRLPEGMDATELWDRLNGAVSAHEARPSLEREALEALQSLEHAAGFVALVDNSEKNEDANRLRTELAQARAVLAKAGRET